MKQVIIYVADVADRVAKVAVVLLMAALVGIISWEVICRYALKIPMVWAEQLASYTMVWLAFISAAIAFRQGAHIGMTLLSSRFTGWSKKLVTVLSHLLILIFLIFLTWWGFVHTADVRSQSSPVVFNISMMWPYLAVPSGAILMILQELKVIFVGYEIVQEDVVIA